MLVCLDVYIEIYIIGRNSRICSFIPLSFAHRFLIARSCQDICCRKQSIAKKTTKSTSHNFDNHTGNYHQCEIANSTYNSGVNNLRIKSLVQIFSTNAKKFVCLGTLIHARAVLTTLECVSA